MRRWSSFRPLSSAVIFILTWFIADGILGWCGLPDEINVPAFYPKNLSRCLPWVESGYYFETNSRGIRYRELPLLRASAQEVRVAVIGDSFVEGQGVEAGQSFCSLLEKDFSSDRNPVYFINCGVSGAGPMEYAEMLYRIGLRYQPDKVLMVIYANDASDTPVLDTTRPHWDTNVFLSEYLMTEERHGKNRMFHDLFPRTYTILRRIAIQRPAFLRAGVVQDTFREARQAGIPESRVREWSQTVPSWAVQLVDHERAADGWITDPVLRPDNWLRALELTDPEDKRKWNVMEGLLKRMFRVCRERGIELAVAYAPHAYQYDPFYDPLPERLGLKVKKTWLTEEAEVQRRVRKLAEDERVPFLDLAVPLREAATRGFVLNFGLDPHWNIQGHRLVASVLEEWLEGLWPDLTKRSTAT